MSFEGLPINIFKDPEDLKNSRKYFKKSTSLGCHSKNVFELLDALEDFLKIFSKNQESWMTASDYIKFKKV